tara:strand:+ start:310 stop:936 length:627 start_codon:yes stop_codon:yes gene_type:complete
MARINGSGFKMKQSPVKGKLSNFFSSLGSQLKQGQKERGIFSEKGKAEKKSRKAGESKYQADIRRRKATKKTKYSVSGDAGDTIDPKQQSVATGPQTPETAKLNKESFPTKGPVKPKTKKVSTKITGAIGSKTRKEQYDAKGWKYDDTIKGYNRDGTKKKVAKKTVEKKTGETKKKIILGSMVPTDLEGNPITMKSPAKNYKKGYYKK